MSDELEDIHIRTARPEDWRLVDLSNNSTWKLDTERKILRRTDPIDGLLTSKERSIIADLGTIAGRIVAVMGAEDTDVNEICGHVHVLQSRVMQQAAARAYPGEFRLHLPRT